MPPRKLKEAGASLAAAAQEATSPAPAPAQAPAKRVKKEKEGVCIAGKEGRALTNAVQYRLRTAPQHIRDVYNKKVKYGKSMTPDERKEFVEHLLQEDWANEYFERFSTTEHISEDKESFTWVSWTKLLTLEDSEAVKLMIKSGAIEHRPDPKLDHDDEGVKALDWHVRQQYKHFEQSEDMWESGCEEVGGGVVGWVVAFAPRTRACVRLTASMA